MFELNDKVAMVTGAARGLGPPVRSRLWGAVSSAMA